MLSVRITACFRLLCCVIALTYPSICLAEQNFQFQRKFSNQVGSNERLHTIHKTLQDHNGFIWFATKRGLIRYDGKRIKKYLHKEQGRFNSPAEIYDLALDKQGRLWVGSNRGISYYSSKIDALQYNQLSPRALMGNPLVYSISIDANDNIFAGTSRGLFISNNHGKHFSHVLLNDKKRAISVNNIFIDSQERIWVGTRRSGIFLLNSDKTIQHHYHADAEKDAQISGNTILSITEDAESSIWISILSKGLAKSLINNTQFKEVKYLGEKDRLNIEGIGFHHLFNDSKNNLWLGTNGNGIFFVDGITNEVQHIAHSSDDGNSLVSNTILNTYEDEDGNFWLSSFPHGVNYLNNEVWKFQNFKTIKGDANSLPNNTVVSIFSEKELLWIGTEGGLASLNKSTGKITQYTKENTKGSLRANGILSIEKDVSGDLWIGTWSGGLHRFDPHSGTFKHYPISTDTFHKRGEFIWDILRTHDDNIWVGTREHGLALYQRESDSFKIIPHKVRPISKNVRSLLEDKQHNIWVGTKGGLWHYTPEKQSFQYFLANETSNSISGNKISSLFEDQRGNIWIGKNEHGVDIFDPVSKQFSTPDFNELLPSQNIASIVQDIQGDMWIGTSDGLVRVAEDFYKQRIFLQDDGLAGDSFMRNNFTLEASGKIIVGSTNGLSIFDPEHFDSPTLLPKAPLVTGLSVNGNIIQAGQDSLLTQAISHTSSLTLSHKDTLLSFEISPLNYRSPKEARYFYKLDGHDTQWRVFNNDLVATYTNLAPGNYTFHVKARKVIAEIDSNKTSIAINILPSIWQTQVAYLAYLCALSLALFALFYFVSKSRKQRKDITQQHQFLQFKQLKESYLINKAESLDKPSSRMAELVNSLLLEAETSEAEVPIASSNEGACILIIEDNVTNRMITRSILNLEKYQVYEATTGAEALEIVEQNRDIRLVLLSMSMVDTSASYICKQIRKHFAFHRLPIIFLCDEAEEQALLTCYSAGGNDFILRPAMKKEVLARVKLQLLLQQQGLEENKQNTSALTKNTQLKEEAIEEVE